MKCADAREICARRMWNMLREIRPHGRVKEGTHAMKKAFEPKNTLLIILLAVSSLIALLLFLDTFIPVFPTSLDRPDTEEGEAGTGDGSETKKHWWEGIFGRDEPTETDGLTETDEPADEPSAGVPPIYPDTDSPSVGWEDLLVYPSYTEKALIDDYGTPLVRALERLADMEAAGTIQPIDRVGFFDLNGNGVPEVITMGIYNGYVEYIAYDVFCHEWVQTKIGRMCYAELKEDLSGLASEPVVMFAASEALPGAGRVTDGPFFLRSEKGVGLHMIWSNGVKGKGYCVLQRTSATGRLSGPWCADSILFGRDGGHGMLFRDFAGNLKLTLHQPNKTPCERMRIFDVEDNGKRLELKRSGVKGFDD